MMYRIFCLLGLSLASIGSSLACGACGCALGAGGFGMSSEHSESYLALRHSIAKYHPEFQLLSGDGTPLEPVPYKAQYVQVIELAAAWSFTPKWQLSASLPYNLNALHFTTGDVEAYQFFGDASLGVNYHLAQTADTSMSPWRHQFTLGLGIELPTGKKPATVYVDLMQSAGSGSWDGLASMLYSVQYKQWGLLSKAGFKLHTANSDNYRFGHQATAAVNVFYQHEKYFYALVPYAGLQYEYLAKDIRNGYYRYATGGQALYATAGLRYFWKQLYINGELSLPLAQQYADGLTSNQWRGSLGVAYLFK